MENNIVVVENPACEELTGKIKGAMYNIAKEFVYIGFLLAECDYFQSYLDWGYSSVHEYASHQLGFKKSSTYNFINVCKTFCQPSNALPFSYSMKESYTQFNFSQLVEMLSMNDKQRSLVTSDMTVKQIREVKKSSDEPDYITLFNQQFKFEEFNYEYIKKIDNKKFRLSIIGSKVDTSDLWPDGYMLSIHTDFGNSGSVSGYQPFVDYDKFKDLIISQIPDSRRLEEAPALSAPIEASPVKADFDLLEPNPVELRLLFDDIDDAALFNDAYDGKDLYDVVLDFFEKAGYVILKKVK